MSRKRFLVSVFAEPFSDGFVVEFQAEIGEENAADDNDQSERPRFGNGEFVFPYPGEKKIHKGIMNHVERIGDITEKFANACGLFVRRFAGCAQKNEHRKDDDDAERVVNAIHPEMRCVADMRNGKQDNDYQTAYPKGTFDRYRLEFARQQQADGIGEEHAYESARKIVICQSPAYADMSVAREIEHGERSQRCAQHYD